MYKVVKYTTLNGECPIDSFISELINAKKNINALTNKKFKKTQNFYSNLFKTNSNNNTQREVKKNDSYIRKYIEISNSNHKNNINTEVETNEKKRNNSMHLSAYHIFFALKSVRSARISGFCSSSARVMNLSMFFFVVWNLKIVK